MKIAITGLSGFLGHYVAKKLFERDVYIKALVRRTSNTSHLKDLFCFSPVYRSVLALSGKAAIAIKRSSFSGLALTNDAKRRMASV